jgi:predicted Zn-dependent peptidase
MSVAITTLPSGLRVMTDSMPHLKTTSLGVWVGIGSRHETEAEHGLSHFLEHMAFKGTRRRSARRIAEEIEGAGGELNAATSTEQTAYYARVLAADTGLALDILADILTESTFEPAEVEREKEVVLEELRSVEDVPDDLVFELFTATAYPGQPIGRAILGTPQGVSRFSRDAVAGFLARRYGADATIVAAAGAVDHDRLVEEASARLEGLSREPSAPAPPARYMGGDVRVKRRFEQAHIVVGFEGVSFHDPDHYATHIFSHAVGGGMSSRLFQTVREERGLAYTINAFDWTYADTGVFGFYAATSARNVAELMPVALDCLAEATQTLDEEEVERAKAQLKVSLLVALESSGARAEQIARQHMAFGRVLDSDEILRKIDAISVADARRVGAAMLRTPPTVSAVGPVKAVLTPDRVAERLGSQRGA